MAKAFSPAQFVMITPGEDRQVDLQLDGGAEARGVVVDKHGQPVAGVDVTLHMVGGARLVRGAEPAERNL